MRSLSGFAACLILCACPVASAGPDLIPWPAEFHSEAGSYDPGPEAGLAAGPEFENEAAMLAQQFAALTGRSLRRGSGIRLVKSERQLPPEAYSLEVRKSGAELRASDPAGMFYGIQTLLQLWDGKGIPCVRIEDSPRFAWRGLMLDCSRTFQSLEYLRKTIDRMAAYKMNVLHLHLTDDQGWRIEIRKYPELTVRGAFFPARYAEPAAHQGYYSQAEMAGLLAYAARRHITVVPEIEMPGHALAALSVLPRLSCTGGPFEIFPFFKGPNITKDILCAGREETFGFVRDVLSEISALFPSKFIHIGGDESPKDRWKACPRCQERMRREGLKTENELQGWFTRRVEGVLAGMGRRLLGWDEIVEGGLPASAAVMSWRGTAGGIAAAREGHDVVMSPTSHCYLDYTYKEINSQRAFSFNPVEGLNADQARHVLGLQANFWSHIDRTPERVDAQLYPRLLAIAERGWSPVSGSWTDYQRRSQAQRARLTRLGVAAFGE